MLGCCTIIPLLGSSFPHVNGLVKSTRCFPLSGSYGSSFLESVSHIPALKLLLEVQIRRFEFYSMLMVLLKYCGVSSIPFIMLRFSEICITYFREPEYH